MRHSTLISYMHFYYFKPMFPEALRLNDEDHRRKFNFKSPYAGTTLKHMYFSI